MLPLFFVYGPCFEIVFLWEQQLEVKLFGRLFLLADFGFFGNLAEAFIEAFWKG